MNQPSEIIHQTYHSTIERHGQTVSKRASKSEFNSRIKKEFEILTELQLLNVPKIAEYGNKNGLDFFEMEFVEGRSLENLAPLSAYSQLSFFPALIFAFAEIHNFGIAHCDIKPENIFVTKLGEPVVLDFGSAVWYDKKGTKNRGFHFRTAGFVAPEILLGAKWYNEVKADVFSLGTTLYFLASGKLPFKEGLSEEVSSSVCFDKVRRIDTPFWTLISNCLQKDPRDRFERMGDVYKASLLVIDGRNLVDKTPSPEVLKARKAENLRVRPAFWYAATTFLCAMIFGVAAFLNSALPVQPTVAIKMVNSEEIPVQQVRLINKSGEFSFRTDEIGFIPPGFYIAEFRNLDGSSPFYSTRHVPAVNDIAKHGLKRMFVIGGRLSKYGNDGVFQYVKMTGRMTTDMEKGYSQAFAKRKGKLLPPDQRTTTYRYATSMCESSKERLPTFNELKRLRLDTKQYHYLERYLAAEEKLVHYVKRDGNVLSHINKDIITRF